MRPKEDTPAIVGYVWLLDGEDNFLAGWIGSVRIGGRLKAGDDSGAIAICIADVEVLFGGIARRKGQISPQQLTRRYPGTGHRTDHAASPLGDAGDNADAPPLLDHEKPAAVIAGVGKMYGQIQPGDDSAEFERRRASILRGLTEHAHLAPSDPTRAVNSADEYLVYAARRFNRHFQGLPIFRMIVSEPLVERARARTVSQPDLMRGWTGRGLRDDQLYSFDEVMAIKCKSEPPQGDASRVPE